MLNREEKKDELTTMPELLSEVQGQSGPGGGQGRVYAG